MQWTSCCVGHVGANRNDVVARSHRRRYDGRRIGQMIPGSVMEAIRFFGLLALTALVVAANISLVRLIVNWWDSSTVTIGPFVVIQPPKELENMKDSIGQLLQAEVTNAVSQIDKITLFAKSPGALTISQPPIQPAQLSVKFWRCGGERDHAVAPVLLRFGKGAKLCRCL
jgi:hypothetical protein